MSAHSFTMLPSKTQYGTSMIEVLVAIIILSVGLLGVASLQGMSKQSSYQSYQRTLATNLMDGIIERIRANPAGAANYNTGLISALGGGTIISEPTPTCESGTCTAAQLAAHDLWEFEQAIDGADITVGTDKVGGLLNPKGCIVFTPATGKTNTGQLSVILSWEGMTNISDAATTTAATCGNTATGTDASRRQVVFNAYLVDASET